MPTRIEFVTCHRLPERSFFWRRRQFPVCARCTGIHIGYISYPFFLFNIWVLPLWVAIFLMLPTILDGLAQAFLNVESTNWRRFSTGLIAGVGTMSLCCHIGDGIVFLLRYTHLLT